VFLKKRKMAIKIIVWGVAAIFVISLFAMAGNIFWARHAARTVQRQFEKEMIKLSPSDAAKLLMESGSYEVKAEDVAGVLNMMKPEKRRNFMNKKGIYSVAYQLLMAKFEKDSMKGIEVSTSEVKKAVDELVKANFGDWSTYNLYLKKDPTIKEKIEKIARKQVQQKKFIESIVREFFITDQDIFDYYAAHISEFKVKKGTQEVVLPLKDVRDKIIEELKNSFPKDKLKRFYEKFKYAFQEPDKVLPADIYINPTSPKRLKEAEAKITPEMLKNFYETHKFDKYATPRKALVEVWVFNPASVEVRVTENEAKKYWRNSTKFNYSKVAELGGIYVPYEKFKRPLTEKEIEKIYNFPAEVYARHILVKSKKEAERIRDEITTQIAQNPEKAADIFAEAARKYSIGPSAKYGGSLGWFGVDAMVAPFEIVAFQLATGEVSKPVRTRYGWHIVFVEKKRGKLYKEPIEKVRDEIVKKWSEKFAKYEAMQRVGDMLEELRDKKVAASVANRFGFIYERLGKMYDTLQPENSELKRKAPQLFEGRIAPYLKSMVFNYPKDLIGPLTLKDGIEVLVRLDVATREGKFNFDQVKAECFKAVEKQKREDKAYSEAQQVSEALKEKGSVEKVGKKVEVWEEGANPDLKGVVFSSSYLPQKFVNKVFNSRIFGPEKCDYGWVVVHVLKVYPKKPKNFEEVKDQVKKDLAEKIARKDAMELANRLAKIVNSDNFGEYAKKYTDGAGATEEGVLDWCDENTTLFSLKTKRAKRLMQLFDGWTVAEKIKNFLFYNNVGTVSGAIDTTNGWHILKIMDRKHGKVKSFDKVKSDLEKFLPIVVTEKEVEAQLEAYRKKYGAMMRAQDEDRIRALIRKSLLNRKMMEIYNLWLDSQIKKAGYKVYWDNFDVFKRWLKNEE